MLMCMYCMQCKMHNKDEGIKRREQIAVIKLNINREVAHKEIVAHVNVREVSTR